MAELTETEFAAATARGEARLRGPRAVSAHYDAARDRVIVRLTTGIEIGFAPDDAEGLEHATAEDLAAIELAPSASASISRGSMPISTCRRSSKGRSARGAGWPPGWVLPAGG